jgi:hypothetical protein
MVDKGHKKTVWITWKYAAGDSEGLKALKKVTWPLALVNQELEYPFRVEFRC